MGRIYDALQQAERERMNGSAPARVNDDLDLRHELPATGMEPAAAVLSALSRPLSLTEEGSGLSAHPHPEARACMWSPQPGFGAEAFRRLAWELEQWTGKTPPRVLLITSAGANEGKTTVALNLAAALARSGRRRVLLLEASPQPRLAARLGVEVRGGLADWLCNQEPVQRFCVRLEPWPLYLLPAGEGGWNLENLCAAPIRELLTQLRQELDWIVLDGPALLPVAEAQHWAQWVDGVLLVARAGISRKPELAEAWRRVAEEKRLGWVLNQADSAAGKALMETARREDQHGE